MEEKREQSRSARKRTAKGVEDLAQRLVELPEAECRKLPTSPGVQAELDLARATKGHGSRKRQTKHLAAVLRREEEETEALRSFLAGLDRGHLQEARDFHELEGWRDRLCDAEQYASALREVALALPGIDQAALGRLARSVHASGDRRAFREIFRRLREAKGSGPAT